MYDLNDEAVKLIAYTIVSVKRDAERVMPEGEGTIIVTDRMNEPAFISWIIARYVQKRMAGIEKEEDSQRKESLRSKLEEELEEHRKYLRVYYVVSYRWPREPLEFEERQMASLERIRQALPDS